MNLFRVICTLALTMALLPAIGQLTVAEISFHGLKKTVPGFLTSLMQTEVNQSWDPDVLDRDIRILKQLDFFYDLHYSVDTLDSGSVRIKFDMREKITALPIFNFGGVRDNFWFRLGGMDVNFLGKGSTFGLFYTYYERHSYNFFFEWPIIGKSDFGYRINALRRATREPVYFKGQSATYNYDNITIEALGRLMIRQNLLVYAGGTFLYEKYEKIASEDFLPEYPRVVEKDKWILKSRWVFNNVNYDYNYLSGTANVFSTDFVLPTSQTLFHWKIINEFRAFARLSDRGNLAGRLRLGFSKNTESPFVPFVLDSYLNIRGSGNRVARGIGEVVLNLEYRTNVIFNPEWGAMQAVIFLDMGSWQPVDEPPGSLLESDNHQIFAGFGGRIYFKKVYNMILRADYGFDLRDGRINGIVLGIGQYF